MTYSSAEDKKVAEILSSIRTIISEDLQDQKHLTPNLNGDGDKKTPLNPKESVLELTQLVQNDGSVVSIKTPHESENPLPSQPQNPTDFTPTPSILPERNGENTSHHPSFRAAELTSFSSNEDHHRISLEVPSPSKTSPSPLEKDVDLSEKVISEVHQSFADLENTMKTIQTKKALQDSFNSQTVDAIVIKLLHPMLKEWLEENLPILVRQLVNEQIEKMMAKE